ncbi:YxeA family protein [Priestia endophytica]|uniref:YxeA family protein n=1 Tax=Priestia endophytica TaxID=135735 RepID=UPI002E24E213|nr:YxeA family protein [Priestia endophytica]
MKKTAIILIMFLVVLGGAFLFLQNVNINRLGSDKYYTQIIGEGKKLEEKATSGEVFVRYEYTLRAVKEDGEAKTVTFTSQTPLRQQAYLELFIKNDKGVTSYEEINEDKVPQKVKEKFM